MCEMQSVGDGDAVLYEDGSFMNVVYLPISNANMEYYDENDENNTKNDYSAEKNPQGFSATSKQTSRVNNLFIPNTIQTQTPKSFLLEAPQRIKYNQKIRKLQLRIRKLQKIIEDSGEEIDNSEDDDFQELFEHLCDKYLTPSMSKFVKSQARRGQSDANLEDKVEDVFIMYGS